MTATVLSNAEGILVLAGLLVGLLIVLFGQRSRQTKSDLQASVVALQGEDTVNKSEIARLREQNDGQATAMRDLRNSMETLSRLVTGVDVMIEGFTLLAPEAQQKAVKEKLELVRVESERQAARVAGVEEVILADAKPGDLVFCHSAGIIGAAIRAAEFLRRDWAGAERPGAEWNHVAVLGSCAGDPRYPDHWTVIQAEGRGVSSAPLSSVAPGGTYEVVPALGERAKVVTFMEAALGSRYGFVTVASIVATLLTPRFLNVMMPGTWICSAVAAEALRFGGWLHQWPDLYAVSPAQLYVSLEEAK